MMIEVKGFNGYYLCTNTLIMFSNRRGKLKEIRPAKVSSGVRCWYLYKNKTRYRVPLGEILNNSFYSDRSKLCTELACDLPYE